MDKNRSSGPATNGSFETKRPVDPVNLLVSSRVTRTNSFRSERLGSEQRLARHERAIASEASSISDHEQMVLCRIVHEGALHLRHVPLVRRRGDRSVRSEHRSRPVHLRRSRWNERNRHRNRSMGPNRSSSVESVLQHLSGPIGSRQIRFARHIDLAARHLHDSSIHLDANARPISKSTRIYGSAGSERYLHLSNTKYIQSGNAGRQCAAAHESLGASRPTTTQWWRGGSDPSRFSLRQSVNKILSVRRAKERWARNAGHRYIIRKMSVRFQNEERRRE